MLVRITERCNFDCTHCMIKTDPDGKHMSLETYDQVLSFISRADIPNIMISGGEPTLHPNLIKMINMAKSRNFCIMLISNGTFLENNELKTAILTIENLLIQIINDKRYYPRSVPVIKGENICYQHEIGAKIAPFNKALINKLPIKAQPPQCFNLRSISRNFTQLRSVIEFLRTRLKMCTPSINVDGTIVAGESDSCATIGTISDSNETLLNNIKNLICNKCGMVDNLDTWHKQVIGE